MRSLYIHLSPNDSREPVGGGSGQLIRSWLSHAAQGPVESSSTRAVDHNCSPPASMVGTIRIRAFTLASLSPIPS
jgi:hypothetical protein